jgi:hypothetical protein
VLAVDECQHNADELFELAVTAEENGDIVEAGRLYRIVMKSDPLDEAGARRRLGCEYYSAKLA